MKNIIKILLKQDVNYELQMTITEVEKKEEARAREFASRTTYINPCILRLDYQQKPAGIFFWVQSEDHCPV